MVNEKKQQKKHREIELTTNPNAMPGHAALLKSYYPPVTMAHSPLKICSGEVFFIPYRKGTTLSCRILGLQYAHLTIDRISTLHSFKLSAAIDGLEMIYIILIYAIIFVKYLRSQLLRRKYCHSANLEIPTSNIAIMV